MRGNSSTPNQVPSSRSERILETRLASVFAQLRNGGWKPGRLNNWTTAETKEIYRLICGARLKAGNMVLAGVAFELLDLNKPDTVRGVMYSVVSHGWLPDTGKPSYNRIQRLLNNLRKKDVIDYEWIVDNIRATEKPSSWSGLADFADTVQSAYRKNFWAQLPEYVEVIVEKDTVAGRVLPVTQEYDVPLHPLRGYSSTSFAWGIARNWHRIKKPIIVYYIGDHDPSGRDIGRSIQEELGNYSGREFKWVRLAVNPEHFEQFNITPLAPKKKDRRYPAFAKEFGDRCAEVEAIPANALRGMVRVAIESHIPQDQWARLKEIEAEEKRQWKQWMATLPKSA